MDEQRSVGDRQEEPRLAHADLGMQAREALRRHVIEPLLPRCVDREYGGFLVDFDERWRAVGPHHKTLEHASRTTLAFALLDRVFPGEGCDRLARHGCAFLREVMWDAVHGGFFAQVDRSGQPRWEGLKHPHAVTYVAEAFVLAAPLLPPGDGRAWAQRALAWLDDVAWDRADGGYWGSFRRDNERYPDGARLPTPDGRDVLGATPGFKEINTQGDAIEMLTELAGKGVSHTVERRLAWLLELVIDRLDDRSGVLPYLYRRDWRPTPDLARVGFQFQFAHRLAAAAPRCGAAAVARGCRLIDFALGAARHPGGGFCLAVTADGRVWPAISPASDSRQWWVQIEALRALHVFANHDAVGDDARARYRRARDEQWAFVRNELFDARYGGIRESPAELGSGVLVNLRHWLRPRASNRPMKTHGWKDPFHEVGAFIALGA